VAISKFGDLFSSVWSTSKPGDMKNGAGAPHINDALGGASGKPAAPAPRITSSLDDPLYDPYGNIIGGHRRHAAREELKRSLTAGGGEGVTVSESSVRFKGGEITAAGNMRIGPSEEELNKRFAEFVEKYKKDSEAARAAREEIAADMDKLPPARSSLNLDALRASLAAKEHDLKKKAEESKVNRDRPQNVDDSW
jgi:hypothetical protein